MKDFRDNRNGDTEQDLRKIKDEIDEQFKKLGDDIRVSQFLKLLDLRPLKVRVHQQYTSESMIEVEPMAFTKLLIYKEVLNMQEKSTLCRQVRTHLDIAEDLGFTLTKVPGQTKLRRFERERVNPEIRRLITQVADYIKDNCNSKLTYALEQKDKPAVVEENITNMDEDEEEDGRDWSAYNEAKMNENPMFKRIAAEIAKTVQEHDNQSLGANGFSISDQLFCILYHQYTGKAARDIVGDLEELDDYYLEEVPHFNTFYNIYGDPNICNLLQKLVEVTAAPLNEVERQIAVDATGYGRSQYQEWKEVKYEEPDDREKFLKAHIAAGTKTNIITQVNITAGTSHDSPEFEELIENTAKHFEIREVSADKAYSSRDNLEAAKQLGMVPFIPFKENTTGKPEGSRIWTEMFEYFNHHRDEFEEHYHKRSNAESAFAMLKRKFGTKLDNRKPVSQRNELLTKCVAHNICVLIKTIHTLGVKPDFENCADQVLAQK